MLVQMTISEPLETRNELEGDVWEAMARLWFSRKPVFRELARELDLVPPQIMVIQNLDRPKPMRDVAEHLSCNNSNLTAITDRLEERGLVQRTLDPDDRRVRLLVLTDEGREIQRRVMEFLRQPPVSMDSLSEEELESLIRLLAKMEPIGPQA
jgi:DNA-binding MarR family transcriptional regulator